MSRMKAKRRSIPKKCEGCSKTFAATRVWMKLCHVCFVKLKEMNREMDQAVSEKLGD